MMSLCLAEQKYLRWEEERETVQWCIDSNGDEHVDVDLPVRECILGKLQVELISQVAAIGLEAALDLDSLFCGKELGTREIRK